jgi:NADH-quinone oxidoreductase subunit L
VPPLVGFFSKEHVLGAAEAGISAGDARGWLVLLAGLVTVPLTAAYCMRAWLVVDDLATTDVTRHDSDHATVPARAAVTTLMALSVLGGLILLTPLLRVEGHIGWLVALLSLLLIAGAALAVRAVPLVDDPDPAQRLVGSRILLFDNGFGVDRLYVAAVAKPVLSLARLVVFLDREVVDAYVRGTAATAAWSGRAGARAHAPERAASGLAWVVAGVVAVALAGVALW